MSLHDVLPETQIPLGGIGPESAVTISKAVENDARKGKPVPAEVIEASRMLVRNEIRHSLPAGNILEETLRPDEEQIMQDVKAHKVLGKAETVYADEKLDSAILQETNTVDRRIVRQMSKSLKSLRTSDDTAERIEAEEALLKLKEAKKQVKPGQKFKWLGDRILTRTVRIA